MVLGGLFVAALGLIAEGATRSTPTSLARARHGVTGHTPTSERYPVGAVPALGVSRTRHKCAECRGSQLGDESEASVFQQLEGHWALYQATGDAAHKETARARVETLRTHAPARFAASMVERVPLYRAILADAP